MKDIGLERGIVKLLPHNPRWKDLFEEEADFLSGILNHFFPNIEHIGSTSIPGIVAKPIIDIAVAVMDLSELYDIIEIMETNGYEYRGEQGIPDRHLFVKGTKTVRTHHIHLMPITHYQWETHQLFRDYLINHPNYASQYDFLKKSLQQKFSKDRVKYLDGKSGFIEKVIEIAQKEQGLDKNKRGLD
jgi:GrpB-like predicted nucleotidyltransferase (UPF0157 family)